MVLDELQKQPYSGRMVLVADDDKVIRASLGRLCESMGFDVIMAKDGAEAWQKYQASFPDLVISDIYMPKVNGLFLLMKIKQADETCPVILITGYQHFIQLLDNDETKPDGFITKPFNMEAILKVISNVAKEHDLVV
jgi:DNA-binding NtrC family response regulator